MSRERAGGMNDLATAAVAYARRGWFVFPVAARGKTPVTRRGMLDASTDTELVAAWWEQRPQANIGVACGPSGLLVVDLDGEDAVRAWADLAARHGGHQRTLVARTGKGFHGYFAGEGRSSAGRIGPRIDTRGGGGYVIAPPSVHGSGAVYRWIDPELDPVPVPEWLTEALDRGQPDSPVGERQELPHGALWTSYGCSALAAITDEMAATVEGERNSTLNALAYRCGRLSAAGQLAEDVAHDFLIAAAIQAGLGGDEAEATFRSGFTAGLFRPVSLEALR
jgi:Bifunctional DNA primase/polymerase, N-terminal